MMPEAVHDHARGERIALEIGEVLGGRDHSTVMSAYEKIKEQIHADRRLEQDIVSIKQQLYNPAVAA